MGAQHTGCPSTSTGSSHPGGSQSHLIPASTPLPQAVLSPGIPFPLCHFSTQPRPARMSLHQGIVLPIPGWASLVPFVEPLDPPFFLPIGHTPAQFLVSSSLSTPDFELFKGREPDPVTLISEIPAQGQPHGNCKNQGVYLRCPLGQAPCSLNSLQSPLSSV